ncbi:MAG TPA: hypothetical protein V6C81_06540 [Planktothrix sp.]|jgi:hypothetical protein
MAATLPKVSLYLHTHWDREWYLPYESYRARLLEVVREIIQHLQSGDLPNFLLDGQACVLEDVVEIDPSLAQPLKDLMARGILLAGPWYVLADQFLVCGESLMRNLAIGLQETRQFGEPAMVGYCPDTFGHTEDMPRILKAFGIDSAFVWRGVPPMDGLPAFYWSSQDGSTVLAHHLLKGYYNTAFHDGKTTAELAEHLQQFVRGTEYGGTNKPAAMPPFLVPVGADHHGPPQSFSKTVQELRAATAASLSEIKVQGLPDFSKEWQETASKNARAFATINGELRDNTAALRYERSFLLQGVLSSRLYLKRANRRAEHRLMRVCEPLYTVLNLTGGFTYPEPELRYAWKLLLKNHPHDSICGCSIDEVHTEMIYRFHKLHQELNALDGRAAEHLLGPGTAGVLPRVALGESIVVTPDRAAKAFQLFNLSGEQVSCPVLVSWAEDPASKVALPSNKNDHIQLVSKERQPMIFSSAGREPDVRTVDLRKAWIWAEKVPPLGSVQFEMNADSAGSETDSVPYVTVEKDRISNGLLSVESEPDGDLIVTAHGVRGQSQVYRLGHRLFDCGDCGDTYNYDPLPDDEPIQGEASRGSGAWSRGPLVGSLVLNYKINIPSGLTDEGDSTEPDLTHFSRARRTLPHIITTEISLRRGVPIVFFDTRWVNKSTDHRLEVQFDTGLMVAETFSENHFAVVRRPHQQRLTELPVAKGCEAPPDTFPCQRFFIANSQLFLNSGLPEYRVNGTTVATTILRAVSQLSRPRLMTRGAGAGPPVATPEANCLGLNEVRYGWAPLQAHSDHEQLAQAYSLAELFEGPLWSIATQAESASEAKPMLSCNNKSVRLSALFMQGDLACLRLLNVTGQAQSVRMTVNLTSPQLCTADASGKKVEELKPVVSQRGAASVYNLDFAANQLRTFTLSSGKSN